MTKCMQMSIVLKFHPDTLEVGKSKRYIRRPRIDGVED